VCILKNLCASEEKCIFNKVVFTVTSVQFTVLNPTLLTVNFYPLAISTNFLKAWLSFTAKSAKIFLSRLTLAFFKP